MSEQATPSSASEIKDGLEWFTYAGKHGAETGVQCARCGSSAEKIDCAECGGDGYVWASDHDDFCDDEYEVRCQECRGTGGSWHCISTPAFCNAHPMPGRDHIASTAMNAEAWND